MIQKRQYLRLFYAIELPNDIKQTISDIIKIIKPVIPDCVRWVTANNLHLTLKFLGDTEKPMIDKLSVLAESIAQSQKPFDYSLKGIGCFPNIKKPNIIWIGTSEGYETLTNIATQIESAIINNGFSIKKENMFKPHITIGRIKADNQSISKYMESIIDKYTNTCFSKFKVDRVSLIQSTLTDKGSIYKTIATYRFDNRF